ncbi:MAG: TonB-dependent receptor [Bacteroidales bacterium]|nr:MAG: TonB-dependent receptor [Bacteroidales bacterium]
MKKALTPVYALLSSMLFSLAVSSQEQDSVRNYPIDEVIISGKRIEMNPIDVGRSVSIFKEEEIKNLPYNNIGELLSFQEGINIIGSFQNPGALQRIYMRGTNSNQALILVDGIRITDPASVENALDLSELSLLNIKRIEIVRGSHSTYYGSSAIGGVINIYTRKKADPGFNIDAGLKTGSFGKGTSEFNQDLFINYTFNNGIYFNGEIFNSSMHGLDAVIDTSVNTSEFNKDRDDFQKRDMAGKIGFKNSRWDVYFAYKNSNQTADLDDGAFRNDNNYTHESKRNTVSYGLMYNINENFNVNFYGGYNHIARTAIDDSSIIDQIQVDGQGLVDIYDQTYIMNNYKGSINNNEIQVNYKGKTVNAFIGGKIYKETMTDSFYLYSNSAWGVYESAENLDTLNLNYVNKSIFAHVDINGGIINSNFKNFSLALGSRYNHHNSYGNNFCYEINPSFKISKNSIIYFSFATGFNSPSLYRLYYPDKYYASSISRGNPDLEPETSESWEFGLKQKFADIMVFYVSYFNTRIKNSIEYVYLWDGSIPIDSLGSDFMRDDHRGDTYLNLGTQFIRGVEFSIRTRLSDKFHVRGNFTLFSGELKYDPSEIDITHTSGNHVQLFNSGKFVNSKLEKAGLVRRSNTANITFSYQPVKSLTLSALLRYVGPRVDVFYDSNLGPWGAQGSLNIDDYTLMDLSARLQLADSFYLLMHLENIFDTRYSEIAGYTTRGRGVSLTVRYTY